MKSCLYFSLLSSVIFSGTAFAACTPSPDCASLGYTATSCPDGGVKCPFDTSKWHCDNPCDSSYKYTCSGTGYAGGVGTACSGKFTSCTCSSGYTWKNGSCQKSKASYVYYCCGSCGNYSYCINNYGYETCGVAETNCYKQGGKTRSRGCSNVINRSGYDIYQCDF